jgi:hypothetical protein
MNVGAVSIMTELRPRRTKSMYIYENCTAIQFSPCILFRNPRIGSAYSVPATSTRNSDTEVSDRVKVLFLTVGNDLYSEN